jgi:hypothetical protein
LGSRHLLRPRKLSWSFLVSDSALDREHGLDLVRFASVDGRLAAFVVKRMDDYLKFTVAIQIKNCGETVYIRRDGLIRFRVDFTGYKFCLNISVDDAPQDDDGITSTLRSLNWRLRKGRRGCIV